MQLSIEKSVPLILANIINALQFFCSINSTSLLEVNEYLDITIQENLKLSNHGNICATARPISLGL